MNQACQILFEKYHGFGVAILLLIYNSVITMGMVMALPVMVPLAVTRNKRRQTLRQRLGWWRYPWQSMGSQKISKPIWVHALSVGEVIAAQPMIEKIKNQHPDSRIVLTVSTLTGFQTAARLFVCKTIDLAYFPYDLIWSVRKVADMIDAEVVILVETDIWPNFLVEMKRRRIPVYLVNIRLSDSAWHYFRRFRWLSGKLFKAFEKICLQTPEDANRMSLLGIPKERLCVSGNIKFDGVGEGNADGVWDQWQKRIQQSLQQPVIVAGSTHDGEEQILLDAVISLKKAGKAIHLIIAPRDPERTQDILALCSSKGLEAIRLSQRFDRPLSPSIDVMVVGFIGALKALYSLAAVAFIGGSLVKEGGHNPLEPAHFGKPVVFGPGMRDFRQIAAWLLNAGGARQVTNVESLTLMFSQLLDNSHLAATMGERARQVVQLHQGAVAKTLSFIDLASRIPSKSNRVEN